jgi:hypothetical protein
LFDDAVAAYERLARAMPEDPAVTLRLAMAHGGAGRLDVATRLLDRVSQTGGRNNDGRLGELASITRATLLAHAREAAALPPETDALLLRRLVQTPLPDVASVILVQTPPADPSVEVRVARTAHERDEEPPDLNAASMGLSAVRVERGAGTTRVRLIRPGAGVRPASRVTVTAFVLVEDRSATKLVTRDVTLGDKNLELQWNGETLL